MFQKKIWKNDEVINDIDLNRIEDALESSLSSEEEISIDSTAKIRVHSKEAFSVDENTEILLSYKPVYSGPIDSDFPVKFTIASSGRFSLPEDYEFSSDSISISTEYSDVYLGYNVYSPLSYSSETGCWVSTASHTSTVGYCIRTDSSSFNSLWFIADSYYTSSILKIMLKVKAQEFFSVFSLIEASSKKEVVRMTCTLEINESPSIQQTKIINTYIPVSLSSYEIFKKFINSSISSLTDEEIDVLLLEWFNIPQEELSSYRESFKQQQEAAVKAELLSIFFKSINEGAVNELSLASKLATKKLEPRLERNITSGEIFEVIPFYKPPIRKNYQGNHTDVTPGIIRPVPKNLFFYFTKDEENHSVVESSVGGLLLGNYGRLSLCFVGGFYDPEQDSIKEWKDFPLSLYTPQNKYTYSEEGLSLTVSYGNSKDNFAKFTLHGNNTTGEQLRIYGGIVIPSGSFQKISSIDSLIFENGEETYLNFALKKNLTTNKETYVSASHRTFYEGKSVVECGDYELIFSTLDLLDSDITTEEFFQYCLDKGSYLVLDSQ